MEMLVGVARVRFRASLLLGPVALSCMVWPRAASAADTDSSARPPALEGRTGCELWVGKVRGNDPSVLIEALICDGMDGAVTGQLQWSSLQSGYSIRDIAGRWRSRDQLSLRDTTIAVSKPNAGWVFCPVDVYELSRSGEKLSGSYTSKKCNDRATVALTKKVTPPAALPPEPPDPEPAVSEAEAIGEPAKDPQPTTRSCACRASRADVDDTAWAALLAALAIVSCARRSRARWRAAKPRASG